MNDRGFRVFVGLAAVAFLAFLVAFYGWR